MADTQHLTPNTSSEALFERAKRVIPGGVNSPVRAFGAVGGTPVFIERGQGTRIFSVDGREFLDFCGSWGALILGHAHPAVVEAIKLVVVDGTSFGANTEREVEMAELLCEAVPYLEMVRLVNSGTEAAMTALRLARGYTNRNKILKFDGCYHGHSDCLLVSAGSGLLTGGIASSEGVTHATAGDVLVAPYNNIDAVSEIAAEYGDDLAAIIVEPVAGNMGLVPPANGFLSGLHQVADDCGAVLIFDEVITGFRFGPTTYGSICNVIPDLTCLGKIIGGGMPIGAVAGRAKIMKSLAPVGKVYQAGTLSGNPVAVAAGLATLKLLMKEDPYPLLERLGKRLSDGLNATAREHGIDMHCFQKGSMFTVFFTEDTIRNLREAKRCNINAYAAFFRGMLKHGIYIPPSQFEVSFISAVHTDQDIDRFVEAAGKSLSALSLLH